MKVYQGTYHILRKYISSSSGMKLNLPSKLFKFLNKRGPQFLLLLNANISNGLS